MAPASASTSATASRIGSGPALAQHDVERIAHRILLRQVHGAAFQTRGDRRGDVRMTDVRGDERVELGDERGRLFGGEIETKHFDGDEPIASPIGRLVRAEDRTQRARTNLMENPEGPECLWRKVQDRIFAVQRPNGNMNSLHIPVDIRRFPWDQKARRRLRVSVFFARAVFFRRSSVARVVDARRSRARSSIRVRARS